MNLEVPFNIIVTGTYIPDPRNQTKANLARQTIRDIHFRTPVTQIHQALKAHSSLKNQLLRNFPNNTTTSINLNTEGAFQLRREQLQHMLVVNDDNTFTFTIPFIVEVSGTNSARNMRPGVIKANIQSTSEDSIQLAENSFKASKYFSNIHARVGFPNHTNNATRRNRRNRKSRRRSTQRRG